MLVGILIRLVLAHQIGQQRIRVIAARLLGELCASLGILLLLGSQLCLGHQPVCLSRGCIYPTLPTGQQVSVGSFLQYRRSQITTDGNLCEIVQRINGLHLCGSCSLMFHGQMQVGACTVACIP